uniref:Uncharacterized protein isoform X3 n=1 Tax=Nicotiana tabacum TaxID=4097 RepID=A0A1S3XJQ2_TOBAC|nr:PREDICTED: uncharacterized protein LOC107765940 isoform X3 [Nicotiana tabacum]
MSQERPSKPKRKTSATYTKPGTTTSLANQIRMSYSQKYIIPARQSNKEQLNVIVENLSVAVAHAQTRSTTSTKYVALSRQSNKEQPSVIVENLPEAVAHVQTRSTTTQGIEEQAQLDSTTHVEDEQCEEQLKALLIKQEKEEKKKIKSVHGRHERKWILLNNINQPVSPSDVVVAEFGSFLGTLARNVTLCPLDILDWRKMDTKEDIWEYTKNKHDIPDSAKRYTFETVRDSWRKHKCKLKDYHFDPYESGESRMQHVPEDVPVCQFKELLRYWNSEKLQKMSKTNIENRKKLKNPHTAGKRSFALVRSKLEKDKTTPDPLLPKEVFVATRKRKVGRSYNSSDEDTISKIVRLYLINVISRSIICSYLFT